MPLEHLRGLTPVVLLLIFEHLKILDTLFFFTYLYMCIYIGEPLFQKIHCSIPTEKKQLR